MGSCICKGYSFSLVVWTWSCQNKVYWLFCVKICPCTLVPILKKKEKFFCPRWGSILAKKNFRKFFFGIFKVENAISKFLKNFFEFCFKFLEQKKIFFGFLGKNFFLPQKFQKSPKPQGTTLGKKNFFRKKIFWPKMLTFLTFFLVHFNWTTYHKISYLYIILKNFRR